MSSADVMSSSSTSPSSSSGSGSELDYLKKLVSQVGFSTHTSSPVTPSLSSDALHWVLLTVGCADVSQLQNKITQLEDSTSSSVSSAMQTAKNAVGMGGDAPRMVLIGPPGAGTSAHNQARSILMWTQLFRPILARPSSGIYSVTHLFNTICDWPIPSLRQHRERHTSPQYLQQIQHLPLGDRRHAAIPGDPPDRSRKGRQKDHGSGRSGQRRDHGEDDQGRAAEERAM